MREALVFYSAFDDPVAWQSALGAELPDLEFRGAPDIGDPARVRYVLAWKPPAGRRSRIAGYRGQAPV